MPSGIAATRKFLERIPALRNGSVEADADKCLRAAEACIGRQDGNSGGSLIKSDTTPAIILSVWRIDAGFVGMSSDVPHLRLRAQKLTHCVFERGFASCMSATLAPSTFISTAAALPIPGD